LFATLFEASMIDKQLANKPIHFEISIGECVSLVIAVQFWWTLSLYTLNKHDIEWLCQCGLWRLWRKWRNGSTTLLKPIFQILTRSLAVAVT